MSKTLYEILEVDENADIRVIKESYLSNDSGAESSSDSDKLDNVPQRQANPNQFFLKIKEDSRPEPEVVDNVTVQELKKVIQNACLKYTEYHKWFKTVDNSNMNIDRNVESGYLTLFRHWNAADNASKFLAKMASSETVDGVINTLNMYFTYIKTHYDNHSLTCYLLDGLSQYLNDKKIPHKSVSQTNLPLRVYWLELKRFLLPNNQIQHNDNNTFEVI